jgi:hypothetical protein
MIQFYKTVNNINLSSENLQFISNIFYLEISLKKIFSLVFISNLIVSSPKR